jgi:hypothetical protein
MKIAPILHPSPIKCMKRLPVFPKLSTANPIKKEPNKMSKIAKNAEASWTTSSGGSESFSNCTVLRKVYPNGVPADHLAYQSKMDRDKDNYACEN